MSPRTAALAVLLASTLSCFAQADQKRPIHPWGEITFGYQSPAGVVGGIAGLYVRPYFIPAVAYGFGGPEGMNLSVGNEVKMAINRKIDLIGWVYWTFANGKRHDIAENHYYVTSSSDLLKVGASYILEMGHTDVSFGLGYAWFTDPPHVTGTVPEGSVDQSAANEAAFMDSAVIRIGLCFGR